MHISCSILKKHKLEIINEGLMVWFMAKKKGETPVMFNK